MRKRENIMLAHPAEQRRIDALGPVFFTQPKLNGVRCYGGALHGDESILLSSTGLSKPYLRQIKEQLLYLPPYTYDGELYIHGKPWNYINSIASRTVSQSPNESELEFHIFDIMSGQPFKTRYAELYKLNQVISARNLTKIKVVETHISSPEHWPAQLAQFEKDKYEGIIFRAFEGFYQTKRSPHLLKLKPTCTDLYKIVSAIQGTGWCFDSLGAFVVQDKHGNQFQIGSGAYLTAGGRKEAWEMHISNTLSSCHLLVKHEKLKTKNGFPQCAVAVELITPDKFEQYKNHEDLRVE